MLYLLTSGLKLKVNEVQLTDPEVKPQTSSIFQRGHWPHPSPYPTTMRIIRMVQLRVNKDKFSIKIYFKSEGQLLPSHDDNMTSKHTYPGSTSAANTINYKQLKESHWNLLTNTEFYNPIPRYDVGNTCWNLWSLWLKSLAFHQAQPYNPCHFISLHWHICWQVCTRGLCG